MVVFDAVSSASSASAFAALLAAIVLSITAQLSTAFRKESEARFPVSLSLAVPTLVLLLTATYMFVVLSGLKGLPKTATTSEAHLAAPADMAKAVAEAAELEARTASLLFAIAGSCLAIGATAAILTIRATMHEMHPTRDSLAERVTVAAACVGIVSDIVFLSTGYDDIHRIFFSGRHLPSSSWWWTMLALAGPSTVAGVAAMVRRRSPRRWSSLDELYWDRLTAVSAVSVALFSLLPTVAFRLILSIADVANFDGTDVLGVIYACAVWSGTALAVCVWSLIAGFRNASSVVDAVENDEMMLPSDARESSAQGGDPFGRTVLVVTGFVALGLGYAIMSRRHRR